MLHGRKTSVSLEQPFWHAVQTIANERSVAAGALIAEIDSAREDSCNLSSAIRTFVLAYYVSRDGSVRGLLLKWKALCKGYAG
jgi:predicted DNA-binding ribbon-helix-helix protein